MVPCGLDNDMPHTLAHRFFRENLCRTASQRESTKLKFVNGNCHGYSACKKCSKNLICIRM